MELIKKELIPSCDESVHASSIAVFPDGTAAAAWFGGTKEGADDVGIRISRRKNGRWGRPYKIKVSADTAHWNPVLMYNGNALHLFHKVGKTIPQWRTMHAVSYDLGRSFSVPGPVQSPCAHGGPVKNKPLVLSNGSIIAPGSTETSDGRWFCFAERSYDGGFTWRDHTDIKALPLDDGTQPKLIQPSFWESDGGKIHALCRSAHGCLYRFDSLPGGGFSEAYPTDIPNSNSGIDLVRLGDGRIVLASNPVSGNWAPRSRLTLSVSDDGGKTFVHAMTLEDEESGEVSYSAVISCGGRIYVSYTYNRKNIAFLEIAP